MRDLPANIFNFPFSANAGAPSHSSEAGKMHQPIDRDTFDRLMLENLPAAQRFALRLTGNLHAAEDLVQETMFRAARAWQSFAGQAAFRTWLFQIVVNVFRGLLRSREADEPLEDLADAPAADPLETAELGELVARLVSNLPARQRQVLVLVAYEGFTPTEAAEVLGISQTSARANLAYARERLREKLARYLDLNDKR
jgi:RNA polymerase sigma-70 factor (ECF subfamily)